ncbi:MAG: hypothetical protein FVQ80_17470 [Planctomycetes bacterium]|nr:hypothetical protein [Planctomycetota bacterium]
MKKQQLFSGNYNPQIGSQSNVLDFSGESPNYHCDNILRGGPSVHFLKTFGTWIPPKSKALFELIAPHYSCILGGGYQYVDSIFEKGDTFDR